MKTFAQRRGMTCMLLALAMPASGAEQEQPAAATDAPISVVTHGSNSLTPLTGAMPLAAEPAGEQGEAEENRLRFVTAEPADEIVKPMKERLADPAQRAELRAEQWTSISRQHADVREVLELDAATEQKLIDVLTEQQMKQLELFYLRPGGGPFDMQGQADATTQRMEALRKLLGEDGLDRFERYSASLADRHQVNVFSARLAGDELSFDQKERLIALLHERTRRSVDALQSSAWTVRQWQRGEPSSPDEMQRQSLLGAINLNEASWRERAVTNREIQMQAAAFLTPTQLAALSKWHAEEQQRLQRHLESMRAQAGLDPKIPERSTPAPVSEQPRLVNGQVQVEIRLKVNRAEPVTVTQIVSNGQSFTFEAADGLIAEATPRLYENHWLDLQMTYYEQHASEKRRLSGGGSFGLQTRRPDGTPASGGGGGTVLGGRQGYAIEAMISATEL